MAEEMSAETALEEEQPKKSSKLLAMVALLLALGGAGGGFFATYSGMFSIASLLGDEPSGKAPLASTKIATNEAPVFVPVGEIVVPLGPAANARFLYVTPELEVAAADAAAVKELMPRVRDMFNTYLRAVESRDLEQPDAMTRIRSQLLRRLTVIAEQSPPRDLLFTSFILK